MLASGVPARLAEGLDGDGRTRQARSRCGLCLSRELSGPGTDLAGPGSAFCSWRNLILITTIFFLQPDFWGAMNFGLAGGQVNSLTEEVKI